MNLRSTLLAALFLPLFAQAQSSPAYRTVRSRRWLRALLEQDPPLLLRGHAGCGTSRINILDASPYEWTARATGQRRRVENEANSNEWNVALERTIRLPAKASADRKLGQATVDEAEARYGEAMHEAARDLLELWMAWLQANANYELSKSMQQFAVENLSAVQKRAKAGDAAKLDVSLAQSRLAEQRRQTSEAKLGASLTWTQLHSRFPGFDGQFSNFPNISALAQDSGYLQARIREQSDRFKAAEAAWRSADAQAQRSRAERTPDPTLGVFSGSEARGRSDSSAYRSASRSRVGPAARGYPSDACGGGQTPGT
jgi:outer membrane protein TolC